MTGQLLVVALGGNALLRKGQKGSFEEQYDNVVETSKYLADLVERGYRLVVTHGNGPQIGATMLRHDAGLKLYNIPPFPMDVCGAETQGFIGYMIQQALRTELKRRGIDKYVITVITRVIVDP
ncbi:MAG: carbamate kinase, partial [Thaumarchaeota archaeon]|nr:carbamate kinase [Candidatus Calditenuaceae archaeon]MDW8187527.1 carbamate kinase [Nitrososphaerota archaeon]